MTNRYFLPRNLLWFIVHFISDVKSCSPPLLVVMQLPCQNKKTLICKRFISMSSKYLEIEPKVKPFFIDLSVVYQYILKF